MPNFQLFLGDCLDILPTLDANSIGSVVCDPPYGYRFMGKNWDHGVPGVPFWEAALRVAKPGAHLLAFGGTRTFHRLTVAIEDAGWEIRDCLMWLHIQGMPKSRNSLKPAWEPIVLAMKTPRRSLANNTSSHGSPALNIDTSRISGRWPANLILNEEVAVLLDEQSGERRGATSNSDSGSDARNTFNKGWAGIPKKPGYADSGGASRFFFCSKASKRDRNDGLLHGERNIHIAVKPTDLLRYLIRLVTPPGGTVLDPFVGSGSTLKAAILEGFDCAGIDLDPDYLAIARARIEDAKQKVQL